MWGGHLNTLRQRFQNSEPLYFSAYGIDIASHKGAVENGATACVLGSGLANIYPAAHTKYIDKILEKGGCLISEFTLDEAPLPVNFPRRNRIISGLSKAIAVIEAGYKSGSLITCRFALEQNREIFAVPAFPGGRNSATMEELLQMMAMQYEFFPEPLIIFNIYKKHSEHS